MPTTIFCHESGNTETRLVVNGDGTVTYHKENAGWKMVRKGIRASEETMSTEEAKKQWPSYADAIDAAVKAMHK
jgi:hypothetical protein